MIKRAATKNIELVPGEDAFLDNQHACIVDFMQRI